MIRWKKPSAPVVPVGKAYLCTALKGGPLDGVRVLHRTLKDGPSLIITLHGMTGYYHHCEWKEVQLG